MTLLFPHRLLLLLAICAATTAAPEPEPGDWDAFAGEWLAEAGAADVVEHSVRSATASMNFLTRPIARRRLLSQFPAPTDLHLRRDGNLVVLKFLGPGAVTHILPVSGAEVLQHGARVSIRIDGTALRHAGATDEGRRETVFQLGSTPDLLTMETTITSPQLPQPVHYALSFKRLPVPAAESRPEP